MPLVLQARNVLDIYSPAGPQCKQQKDSVPALVFVTGGAWTIGYKAWGALLARRLSRRGVLVFCLDYRNFPQVCALRQAALTACVACRLITTSQKLLWLRMSRLLTHDCCLVCQGAHCSGAGLRSRDGCRCFSGNTVGPKARARAWRRPRASVCHGAILRRSPGCTCTATTVRQSITARSSSCSFQTPAMFGRLPTRSCGVDNAYGEGASCNKVALSRAPLCLRTLSTNSSVRGSCMSHCCRHPMCLASTLFAESLFTMQWAFAGVHRSVMPVRHFGVARAFPCARPESKHAQGHLWAEFVAKQ